jgi:hypothetical protein
VYCVRFLGFHPYKEVIFLRNVRIYYSAVALHLNGTKVRYLGGLHPGCYQRDMFELLEAVSGKKEKKAAAAG